MSTPVPTQAIPPTPPTKVTTFYEHAADGTLVPLTFQWTKQMPEKGYLGNVTFRQFQKKLIQVFDPEPVYTYGTLLGWSWGYQAQDGSFLCRMFVSAFIDSYVTFSDLKKGNWPVPLTVLPPH